MSSMRTITGMIAHYVSSVVLPMADLVIDVHSGGTSTHLLPSVNMHAVSDSDQMKKMVEAGRVWGAPYVFIYRDVAGEGLLPTQAEKMGKVTLGTEVGSYVFRLGRLAPPDADTGGDEDDSPLPGLLRLARLQCHCRATLAFGITWPVWSTTVALSRKA